MAKNTQIVALISLGLIIGALLAAAYYIPHYDDMQSQRNTLRADLRIAISDGGGNGDGQSDVTGNELSEYLATNPDAATEYGYDDYDDYIDSGSPNRPKDDDTSSGSSGGDSSGGRTEWNNAGTTLTVSELTDEHVGKGN